MAYQKTDGTLQDVEYIVGRLVEGFAYEEAIKGMKMPIDPGTPERPGWCYRNRELLKRFATTGIPAAPGLTTPARRPVTFLADQSGKMWAIFADNTREEIKPISAKVEPTVAPLVVSSSEIPMDDDNISKVAKRSRKKLQPKEWP